jgi:hypothetical protein
MTRDFSLANMTNFKNDLSSLFWNDVTSINDVDGCFDVFLDNFSTLYDLHFPLTKFKFNKNKHSKNDFMTPGLLNQLLIQLIILIGTGSIVMSLTPLSVLVKNSIMTLNLRSMLRTQKRSGAY